MTPSTYEPAIFLSASVPLRSRDEKYWSSADVLAIQSAVTALLGVVLGRRRLVFGGHPSITPMILVAAKAREVDYGRWVTLYQSDYYEADFPEETAEYQNVVLVPAGRDNFESQRLLRKRMLTDTAFSHGVFIGGMEGVEEEFGMMGELSPQPKLIPVASTGGAARRLFRHDLDDDRLQTSLTYLSLFRDLLDLPSRADP